MVWKPRVDILDGQCLQIPYFPSLDFSKKSRLIWTLFWTFYEWIGSWNSYRNPSEARRTSFVMKTKVNRNTIHNIQRAKLRLVRYWKLIFFVYRKEDVFVNILMYLTTLKNKYFLAKIKSEIWSDIFKMFPSVKPW